MAGRWLAVSAMALVLAAARSEVDGNAAVAAAKTRLKSADVLERCSGADELGRLGGLTREALPPLIAALGDGHAWVRWRAATALGVIGRLAGDAVGA